MIWWRCGQGGENVHYGLKAEVELVFFGMSEKTIDAKADSVPDEDSECLELVCLASCLRNRVAMVIGDNLVLASDGGPVSRKRPCVLESSGMSMSDRPSENGAASRRPSQGAGGWRARFPHTSDCCLAPIPRTLTRGAIRRFRTPSSNR